MSAVPTVEALRLRLRPWRPSDAGPLGAILADPEVTRYLFSGRALDAAEARAAYERRVASWANDDMGFWAVELRGSCEFVGWAGLQVARTEGDLQGVTEVGWTLGRPWWGCGYAVEAAEAGLRWGFEQRGLERIYAFHLAENRRSERVMEKLGMAAAGDIKDPDGSVSRVRVMTRDHWCERGASSGVPNPHGDPHALAEVIGYKVEDTAAFLSPASADDLRDALLDALGRTWPGPSLPGEPRAYRLTGAPTEAAACMTHDRAAGLVPLLISTEISEPDDAGEKLAEIYVASLREGVWLHADIKARHGMQLDGLYRADSIAFDVPTPRGRRRVFATRHRRMLDPGFYEALGVRG